MKLKYLFFFAFLVNFSCNKNTIINNETNYITISKRVKIRSTDNIIELVSGNRIYKIPKEKLPFQRIIFLNSSLIGYALHLGVQDKIIGISSPEYIYSKELNTALEIGKIHNVGNEQKYDIEKIITLNPDAIFTNFIPNFQNTYDIFKQNGIEVIFLDEYMEQNPLEKTAYLKVFGKLLGVEEKANLAYLKISNHYETLKEMANKSNYQPQVIVNEIYGNQWFMSGGKTFIAHYLKDANAHYVLKNNKEKKSIPMTFEQVFALSQNADYWVNIGNYNSKNELLKSNINYLKLNVFHKGKLYSMGKRKKNRANDFYESGAVRADLVLRDYIKIFHPKLINDTLYYMKEIY